VSTYHLQLSLDMVPLLADKGNQFRRYGDT